MRTAIPSIPHWSPLVWLGGCYRPWTSHAWARMGSWGRRNADTDTDGPDLCTVYSDADGDGFGDPETAREVSCDEIPDGAVDNGDDCDDGRDDVFPEAPERCDDADNDCDGVVDEDLEFDWYTDADGDGFGDRAGSRPAIPKASFRTPRTATTAGPSPRADELCDDLDNDCDEVDEDAIDQSQWFADADGDGTRRTARATLEAGSMTLPIAMTPTPRSHRAWRSATGSTTTAMAMSMTRTPVSMVRRGRPGTRTRIRTGSETPERRPAPARFLPGTSRMRPIATMLLET